MTVLFTAGVSILLAFSAWANALTRSGKVALSVAVLATGGTGVAVADTVIHGDTRAEVPQAMIVAQAVPVPNRYRAPDDDGLPPRPGDHHPAPGADAPVAAPVVPSPAGVSPSAPTSPAPEAPRLAAVTAAQDKDTHPHDDGVDPGPAVAAAEPPAPAGAGDGQEPGGSSTTGYSGGYVGPTAPAPVQAAPPGQAKQPAYVPTVPGPGVGGGNYSAGGGKSTTGQGRKNTPAPNRVSGNGNGNGNGNGRVLKSVQPNVLTGPTLTD